VQNDATANQQQLRGSAIAIVDSGKLVYSEGYGVADLNSFEFDKVPFIEDTVADIDSVLA